MHQTHDFIMDAEGEIRINIRCYRTLASGKVGAGFIHEFQGTGQVPSSLFSGLAAVPVSHIPIDGIEEETPEFAFLLIRLVEVIGRVLQVERDPARRQELLRHADLALEAGARNFDQTHDWEVLRARRANLTRAAPAIAWRDTAPPPAPEAEA